MNNGPLSDEEAIKTSGILPQMDWDLVESTGPFNWSEHGNSLKQQEDPNDQR